MVCFSECINSNNMKCYGYKPYNRKLYVSIRLSTLPCYIKLEAELLQLNYAINSYLISVTCNVFKYANNSFLQLFFLYSFLFSYRVHLTFIVPLESSHIYHIDLPTWSLFIINSLWCR